MLEKMKDALSNLGVVANAYIPKGTKEVLLQMAAKIDALEKRIIQLEKE